MIAAHIAGIPVEETALSFGPVLAAGGGIAMLKVRERVARVRRARGAPARALSRWPSPRAARRATRASDP